MRHRVQKKKWYFFKRYLYLNYRSFFVFGKWLKLRFSPAGRLMLVLAGITAALGADTTASVTYQAFSLILVLLVSAWFLSLIIRPRIQATRHLPAMATAGVELIFPVTITLKSRHPIEGAFIVESGPDPRPTFEEFVHIREPGEELRNWVDRLYLYYRWRWLLERNKILLTDHSRSFTLFGDRPNSMEMRLTPLKRGLLELNELAVGIPDPLGLTFSLRLVKKPQKLLVLPKSYAMPDYEFPGAARSQAGSLARGLIGGTEDDFINLRDYRPGDALKQIHWFSSAKARKLIVREYQTSSRSRCGIILDVQCPVARAFDFEVLVSLAASIASAGESAQLDLDFLFVGDQAYCFSTGSGQGEIDQLMQVLASVKYSQQDNWPALRRVVEENADHLQGATFLTLHWNPDRKSMAQFLDKLSIPNQSFVVIPGDSDPENASYHDPDFPNTHFLHPDRIQLQLANL